MASGPFEHRFEGTLEELLIGGRMSYWVVFRPRSLQGRPPFDARRRLRMRGVAGGKRVSMAWQLSSGRHYVMFGRALARSLRLSLGSKIELAFSIVPDADVEVPAELREALRQEPSWRAAWKALTPGKQRGVAHLVRSVRAPELRAQRAVDVLRAVAEGTVPGPPRRRGV